MDRLAVFQVPLEQRAVLPARHHDLAVGGDRGGIDEVAGPLKMRSGPWLSALYSRTLRSPQLAILCWACATNVTEVTSLGSGAWSVFDRPS